MAVCVPVPVGFLLCFCGCLLKYTYMVSHCFYPGFVLLLSFMGNDLTVRAGSCQTFLNPSLAFLLHECTQAPGSW